MDLKEKNLPKWGWENILKNKINTFRSIPNFLFNFINNMVFIIVLFNLIHININIFYAFTISYCLRYQIKISISQYWYGNIIKGFIIYIEKNLYNKSILKKYILILESIITYKKENKYNLYLYYLNYFIIFNLLILNIIINIINLNIFNLNNHTDTIINAIKNDKPNLNFLKKNISHNIKYNNDELKKLNNKTIFSLDNFIYNFISIVLIHILNNKNYIINSINNLYIYILYIFNNIIYIIIYIYNYINKYIYIYYNNIYILLYKYIYYIYIKLYIFIYYIYNNYIYNNYIYIYINNKFKYKKYDNFYVNNKLYINNNYLIYIINNILIYNLYTLILLFINFILNIKITNYILIINKNLIILLVFIYKYVNIFKNILNTNNTYKFFTIIIKNEFNVIFNMFKKYYNFINNYNFKKLLIIFKILIIDIKSIYFNYYILNYKNSNKIKIATLKHLDYIEYCILKNKQYCFKNKKFKIKKKINKILNLKLLILPNKKKINLYYTNFTLIIKNYFNTYIQNFKYYLILLNIKNQYKTNITIDFKFNVFKILLNLFLNNNINYNNFKFIKFNKIFILINYLIEKLNKIINLIIYIYINIINITQNLSQNYDVNFNIINKYKNIKFNFFKYIAITIYAPILIFNIILSDIINSYIFFKFYIKNKIIIVLYKYYKKIIIFKKNITFKFKYRKKKFVTFIKKPLWYLHSKTVFLTFILGTFFTEWLLNNIYIYKFKYLNLFYNFKIINQYIYDYFNLIILDRYILNIFIPLISIYGILKWSRSIHRLFGYFLWTMTVLPLFIEIFRIYYSNLILYTLLEYNKLFKIIYLKFFLSENLISIQIYNTVLILFLILFFKFTYNHGAFRKIYGNFNTTRLHYLKYPIIIITLIYFKYSIIKHTYFLILYNNFSIIKENILLVLNNQIIYKYKLYKYNIIYLFNDNITNEFNLYKHLYYDLIIDPKVINYIYDLILILITYIWLIKYSREFLKKDQEMVAFPLVCLELFIKYYFIFIFIIYTGIYCYYSLLSGEFFYYLYISFCLTFVYLFFRVTIIPKKTMAWYFRLIVEFWPSTILNWAAFGDYNYIEQQRYITLQIQHEPIKLNFSNKIIYLEPWEKSLCWKYQRLKEPKLFLFATYFKLMSRSENMLKEFVIFDYFGWVADWEYNKKKIKIYKWSIETWDSPYFYYFLNINVYLKYKQYFFNYYIYMFRFVTKITHFEIWNKLGKIFYDNSVYLYYLNYDNLHNNKLPIFIYFKKKLISKWKKQLMYEEEYYQRLCKLKRLKSLLLDYSSGVKHKEPSWVFPADFEKEYKKLGWQLFENYEIDNVNSDWRPEPFIW